MTWSLHLQRLVEVDPGEHEDLRVRVDAIRRTRGLKESRCHHPRSGPNGLRTWAEEHKAAGSLCRGKMYQGCTRRSESLNQMDAEGSSGLVHVDNAISGGNSASSGEGCWRRYRESQCSPCTCVLTYEGQISGLAGQVRRFQA